MNCSQIIVKGGLTGHIKQIAKNYNDIYLSKQCTCHYSLKILSVVSSLKKIQSFNLNCETDETQKKI